MIISSEAFILLHSADDEDAVIDILYNSHFSLCFIYLLVFIFQKKSIIALRRDLIVVNFFMDHPIYLVIQNFFQMQKAKHVIQRMPNFYVGKLFDLHPNKFIEVSIYLSIYNYYWTMQRFYYFRLWVPWSRSSSFCFSSLCLLHKSIFWINNSAYVNAQYLKKFHRFTQPCREFYYCQKNCSLLIKHLD